MVVVFRVFGFFGAQDAQHAQLWNRSLKLTRDSDEFKYISRLLQDKHWV